MIDIKDTAIQDCIALERDLHLPSVRGSRAKLEDLLDPQFREISISGRLWKRTATIDALTSRPNPIDQPPTADTEMEGRRIAVHLVLLTYVSGTGWLRARRSSLWRLSDDDGKWRLLHHQGTHVP
jgi:glyoxylase I family protein